MPSFGVLCSLLRDHARVVASFLQIAFSASGKKTAGCSTVRSNDAAATTPLPRTDLKGSRSPSPLVQRCSVVLEVDLDLIFVVRGWFVVFVGWQRRVCVCAVFGIRLGLARGLQALEFGHRTEQATIRGRRITQQAI